MQKNREHNPYTLGQERRDMGLFQLGDFVVLLTSMLLCPLYPQYLPVLTQHSRNLLDLVHFISHPRM